MTYTQAYAYFMYLCIRLTACADRGVVYKVAQWRSGSGRINFVTVAVLRPFRDVVRPIWQMILRTTSDKEVLSRHCLVIIIIIIIGKLRATQIFCKMSESRKIKSLDCHGIVNGNSRDDAPYSWLTRAIAPPTTY